MRRAETQFGASGKFQRERRVRGISLLPLRTMLGRGTGDGVRATMPAVGCSAQKKGMHRVGLRLRVSISSPNDLRATRE